MSDLTVLVVDDSILIRRSLIKLLDTLPNVGSIVEATNAPEAIRLLRESPPDIAIVDIRMPGGCGLDILKKAEEMSKPPMVIILTKYTTQQYRDEAAQAGAKYFFDKSTEFEKVVNVIRDLGND
jgi:DNA-binding NarL/FixJ family response regulator